MKTLLWATVFVPLILGGCTRSGPPDPYRDHIRSLETNLGLSAGLFNYLDQLLDETGRAGAIPGGVLAIHHGGRLAYIQPFGRTSSDLGASEVRGDTLFDTASLTKPLAGVPAAVELDQTGVSLTTGHPTIVEILSHTSGFTDDFPFTEENRENFPDSLEAPLKFPPGEYDHYSNKGYLYLSVLAKRYFRDEDRTEREAIQSFWQKFGADSFTWSPPEGASVACTGYTQGGSLICGRPFDPWADWLLAKTDYLPLHSGLFASAEDVARFAELLMEAGEDDLAEIRLGSWLLYESVDGLLDYPEGASVIYRSNGGLVSAVQPPWARPGTPPGRVFYLTGYTGCLLWVDTEAGISMALLTNASENQSLDAWEDLAHEIVLMISTSIKQEESE